MDVGSQQYPSFMQPAAGSESLNPGQPPPQDPAVASELQELRKRYRELTDQLIGAEEDNVRVSRALLEVKIENNELRQRADAEKEQLLKRVLLAENAVAEKSLVAKEKVSKDKEAGEQLEKLKGVLSEYQALKENFQLVKERADVERKRADDTGLELLNVVNDKNNILKQLKAATSASDEDLTAHVSTLEAEKAALLARVTETERVFVGRLREVLEQVWLPVTEYSRTGHKSNGHGQLSKVISDAVQTLGRYDARSDVMKEVEALRTRVSHLTSENRRLHSRSRQNLSGDGRKDSPAAGAGAGGGSSSADRLRIEELETQLASLSTHKDTDINTLNFEREIDSLKRANDALQSRVESLTQSLEFGGSGGETRREASLQAENSKLILDVQQGNERRARAEIEADKWHGRYNSLLSGNKTDGDVSASSSTALRHRMEDFASSTQAQLERERSELTTRAVKAEAQMEEVQRQMGNKIAHYQREIKRLHAELAALRRLDQRPDREVVRESKPRTPGAPRATNASHKQHTQEYTGADMHASHGQDMQPSHGAGAGHEAEPTVTMMSQKHQTYESPRGSIRSQRSARAHGHHQQRQAHH